MAVRAYSGRCVCFEDERVIPQYTHSRAQSRAASYACRVRYRRSSQRPTCSCGSGQECGTFLRVSTVYIRISLRPRCNRPITNNPDMLIINAKRSFLGDFPWWPRARSEPRLATPRISVRMRLKYRFVLTPRTGEFSSRYEAPRDSLDRRTALHCAKALKPAPPSSGSVRARKPACLTRVDGQTTYRNSLEWSRHPGEHASGKPRGQGCGKAWTNTRLREVNVWRDLGTPFEWSPPCTVRIR